MADAVEVRVPNIGDFNDVPVIEVLVKPGDVVKAEDPLITLESEKAAMEVPSPGAGKVQAVTVKVGDKVSEGTPILTLAGDGAAAPPLAGDGTIAPQTSLAPNGQAKAIPAPASSAAPPQGKSAEGAGDERILDVTVPDIGDFTDIPIIEVLVKPGDAVEKESPLVTLESEKASMEVPSPEAGIVKSVALKVGDRVSKGSKLLTLAVRSAAPSAPAPAQPAPAPTALNVTQSAPPAAPQGSLPVTPSGATIHASPSIRKFARELGVELGGVTGTGPKGRLTREDVQSFVKRALAAPRAATGGAMPFDLPAWPKIDFAKFGAVERQPLSRIKKLSGPNLARNWVMIPHVTNHDDADITDLEQFRNELNAENPNLKITMLAFLIKAVIPALQHYPEVNASLDGDDLVLKKYYHIGFAADTPNGLLVPVVKDADKKGLLQIAAETRDLAAKARDGKLGLAEMQGASFTISSLGGIGGTGFTPIINAPEVAILGVSRSMMRPWWDGKAFVPRLILPLSLSYDHRVIDGAQAARFNARLANILADMRRAML